MVDASHNPSYFDDARKVWEQAVLERSVDIWIEYLERIAVADFFSFLVAMGALGSNDTGSALPQWLHKMAGLSEDQIFEIVARDDHSIAIDERLAAASFNAWSERLRRLLRDTPIRDLPTTGAAQYFADQLSVAIIIGYRKTGSAVEITDLLVIQHPTALLDWMRALNAVQDTRQQDLLRRALYSRHKVIIQRNVLIHVDREFAEDVFGPTIDTLLLNDWLFDCIYAAQRTRDNEYLFEDTLTKAATLDSYDSGTDFLEIGCGNGLITAAWVRNEAKVRSFAAIDVSMSAVSTTYVNSVAQRRLHGASIADRGAFVVAPYNIQLVPKRNQLVVCNPPYVPVPPDLRLTRHHPLAAATVGTTLLAKVVSDVGGLVAPDGKLVIVISELASQELIANVPSDWTCTRVRKMAVPFQIEAVHGPESEQHLNWLIGQRGLRKLSERSEAYEHDIAVYLVEPPSAAMDLG
ncbi:MAG TPA: methyltransferase [Pseudonocardiaceae bacterium]|nr:methyltransferase [Pseudonocardiaceae bacterium]